AGQPAVRGRGTGRVNPPPLLWTRPRAAVCGAGFFMRAETSDTSPAGNPASATIHSITRFLHFFYIQGLWTVQFYNSAHLSRPSRARKTGTAKRFLRLAASGRTDEHIAYLQRPPADGFQQPAAQARRAPARTGCLPHRTGGPRGRGQGLPPLPWHPAVATRAAAGAPRSPGAAPPERLEACTGAAGTRRRVGTGHGVRSRAHPQRRRAGSQP